jgi:hypothetical protein
MPPGVTLITATGGRPESLRRCGLFVIRQTWGGHLQWIIVDDCAPASTPVIEPFAFENAGVEVKWVYPEPKWKPGQNTLARNLLAAIPEVRHDVVLFIEDDDWYAHTYIDEQVRHLGDADIVGDLPARYYHVPTRYYWQLDNARHASLCQTGLRKSALSHLREICEHPRDREFIDVTLWRSVVGKKALYNGGLVVGMKGLPGRAGIGVGHRPDRSGAPWKRDRDFVVLANWIGKLDVQLYEEKSR